MKNILFYAQTHTYVYTLTYISCNFDTKISFYNYGA